MPSVLDPPAPPPTARPVDDGTRRELLVAGAAALVAGTAACGGGGDAGSARATRSVRTGQGVVDVPAAPERIVVSSPALTGYLYALEMPVAATAVGPPGAEVDASGFLRLWSRQARAQGTAALPAGELDIEAVAAARPDLIVGGGQGSAGAGAVRAYDRLSRIAPTVLVGEDVTAWQDQLAFIAEVVGARDAVPGLLRAYRQRVDAVRAAITIPAQPAACFYELSGKAYVVPQAAALPSLLAAVGFRPDDVLAKAPGARLGPSADFIEISEERVGDVLDAPVLFNVAAFTPTEELGERSIYARLPAFRAGRVYDLPAYSYRPDYLGALATLDRVEAAFA